MLDFFKKIAYSLKSVFKRGADPQEVSMGVRSGAGIGYSIPNPVYVRNLFDGKATLIVFGAPFNWNYAGESRADMEAKNPGITYAIEQVMHKYRIKRALVPKPAFNARVVSKDDLNIELLPGFFRGAFADGVILTQPGDAYFLASADCVAAAVYDPRTGALSADHCGRDATIDRLAINEGSSARREHASVIDAAISKLDLLVANTLPPSGNALSNLEDHSQISAYLAAGIRAETFVHPTVNHKYADANKRMIDALVQSDMEHALQPNDLPVIRDPIAGQIDLFALCRRQLNAYGITRVTDDGFDTATSTDEKGNRLFHSNRDDVLKRNLVVIMLN